MRGRKKEGIAKQMSGVLCRGVPNRFGASERALCCNCFAVGACIERFHGGWMEERESKRTEMAEKRRDDEKKEETKGDKKKK